MGPLVVAHLEQLTTIMEEVFIAGDVIPHCIAIGSHSLLGMVITLIATSHFQCSLTTFGSFGVLGVLICPLIMIGCYEVFAKIISPVALPLVSVSITREHEEQKTHWDKGS